MESILSSLGFVICFLATLSYAEAVTNNNCLPLPGALNVTVRCSMDYNAACQAKNNQEIWAKVMFDSNGREESGKYHGNLIYLGDYEQCVDGRLMQNFTLDEELHFCAAFWWQKAELKENHYQAGHGLCLPGSCTVEDFVEILKSVYGRPPVNVTIQKKHCVHPKALGSDAAAIFSIFIASIIGAIVLVASIMDKVFQSKKSDSSSGKQPPGTQPPGTQPSGTQPSGTQPSGTQPSGTHRTTTPPQSEDQDEERSGEEKVETGIVLLDNDEAAGCADGDGDGTGIPLTVISNPVEGPTVRNEAQSSAPETDTQVSGKEKAMQALLAFSLFRNIPRMLSLKHGSGTYKCLHGMRFLSMAWIILGHTYDFQKSPDALVTENPEQFQVWGMQFSYQVVAQMNVAVDTFLVLSAFLVTVSFMRDWLQPSDLTRCCRKICFCCKRYLGYLFHRYWRLTPVYAFVLMLFANVGYYSVNGPLYPKSVENEPCKSLWLTNLFYINNIWLFFGCMGWTWYLAVDFQCYAMLPLFAGPLLWAERRRSNNHPRTKFALRVAYAWLAVPIIVCFVYRMGMFFLIPKDPFLFWFLAIYIQTVGRMSVYFMAVYLGYAIYRTKGNIPVHKAVVTVGWIVAGLCVFITVYFSNPVLHICDEGCSFPANLGLLLYFTVVYRSVFGLAIIWIIFACITGNGGFVNRILSWSIWLPVSKLTYVGYLVHPIVSYVYLHIMPAQAHVSHWMMVYQFIGNLFFTLVISFILSSAVEVPFLNLEKIIFPYRKAKQP